MTSPPWQPDPQHSMPYGPVAAQPRPSGAPEGSPVLAVWLAPGRREISPPTARTATRGEAGTRFGSDGRFGSDAMVRLEPPDRIYHGVRVDRLDRLGTTARLGGAAVLCLVPLGLTQSYRAGTYLPGTTISGGPCNDYGYRPPDVALPGTVTPGSTTYVFQAPMASVAGTGRAGLRRRRGHRAVRLDWQFPRSTDSSEIRLAIIERTG